MPPRKRQTRKKVAESADEAQPKKRTRNTRSRKEPEPEPEPEPESQSEPEQDAADEPEQGAVDNEPQQKDKIEEKVVEVAAQEELQHHQSAREIRIASPFKSPLKRTSLIPTKIPLSPVRRRTIPDSKQDLIAQSFISKNIPKLNAIIDELKTDKSEYLFNEFKVSMETRIKASDNLINSLTLKNHQLLQEIAALKSQLQSSKEEISANSAASKTDYEHELILDMMEQVVGLRIHKAEENDDNVIFDCSQSGKNGVLDYRLIIYKEGTSEILYSPMNNAAELANLKKCLPEYFFDNLSFPIETLQQFYHKIYRGLNK